MPVERSNASSGRGGRQDRGRGRQRRGGHGDRGQRRGQRRGQDRGRGGHSSASGGNGTVNIPYSPPTYPPAAVPSFYITNDPELQTKLSQPGIKHIRFGANFEIKDSHLEMMSAIPGLMNTLEVLSLGDSDTGNGYFLTDAGVQSFLSRAPNLISLTLDACTQLTDATLIHALESCPLLRLVQITGNDKREGQITDAVFKTLREKENLGANLKVLAFYDQAIYSSSEESKMFTKARKEVTIRMGETLGDGVTANMLAAMTGGASTYAYRDGEMIGTSTDMGAFGPGGIGMPFPYYYL
ncbi:hypothetical protein V5O48_012678 [Marasmius crinis-equi]|uniref:Uncharacterized protein n=1 Tax=Marasmius crinis-equi TaxID=585013 RepID=A0ABR3F2E3_9AGAR